MSQQQSEHALQKEQRFQLLFSLVGINGNQYLTRDITKLTEESLKAFDCDKEIIFKAYIRSLVLSPNRQAIYSLYLAIIQQKTQGIKILDKTFDEYVIEKIIDLFQESINFGLLPQAKSILIFLAELSYIGMFDLFSLMEILKDLINEAEKVNKSQICSQTVDFYLELLVSALPHLVDNLEKNTIIEYKNLIQNISSLMMNKQQWFSSNNQLSLQWGQVQEFMTNNSQKAQKYSFIFVRPYGDYQQDLKQVKKIKKHIQLLFNYRAPLRSHLSVPVYELFEYDQKSQGLFVSIARSILTDIMNSQSNNLNQFRYIMAYKSLAVPMEYDQIFISLIVEMCINSCVNNLDKDTVPYNVQPHYAYVSLFINFIQNQSTEKKEETLLDESEDDSRNGIIDELYSQIEKLFNDHQIDVLQCESLIEFLSLLFMDQQDKLDLTSFIRFFQDENSSNSYFQCLKGYFFNKFVQKVILLINEEKMNEDLKSQIRNADNHRKYFRPDCTYTNILDEAQKRIEEQLEKKDGHNMIEFLKTVSRGIIDEYRFYFERFLQIFFKIASLSISHFQKNYYDRYGIVLRDYSILVKDEIQTKIIVVLLDTLDISFFQIRIYLQHMILDNSLDLPFMLKVLSNKIMDQIVLFYDQSLGPEQKQRQFDYIGNLIDVTHQITVEIFSKESPLNEMECEARETDSQFQEVIEFLINNEAHFRDFHSYVESVLRLIAKYGKNKQIEQSFTGKWKRFYDFYSASIL